MAEECGDLNEEWEDCFFLHKMDEEMPSGGTSGTTNKRPKDRRAAFGKHIMSQSMLVLAKEYIRNKDYKPKNLAVDKFMKNEKKNRYTDVFCNDKTRVILTNGSYVHANWVPIPNSMQRFICAHGSLEETAEGFWRMVLQEKCQVIVMLCDFEEDGQPKCECDIESVKRSVLEVSTVNKSNYVNIFQYIGWPDHGAPLNPEIAVDLMKLSKEKSDVRPIVVHCSSGIGQVATFVGLEYANERLKSGDKLGLIDIMKELRAHRLQSIQSHLQYLYLAVSLLEYFAQRNLIQRDPKFKDFLASYISYVKDYAAEHGIIMN